MLSDFNTCWEISTVSWRGNSLFGAVRGPQPEVKVGAKSWRRHPRLTEIGRRLAKGARETSRRWISFPAIVLQRWVVPDLAELESSEKPPSLQGLVQKQLQGPPQAGPRRKM